MSKIDTLVQDFLAQKKIAVVGVSDKRETGCNLGYRKFREAGYTVA
jgi:predicted CoA-binding protein